MPGQSPVPVPSAKVSELIFIRVALFKVLKLLREFMDSDGFVEVETPTLQPKAGGAIAKPFVTHHNAMSIDMFLRIAPELYLKRLIIRGYEKVFEVGKVFRNEGVDQTHSQ